MHKYEIIIYWSRQDGVFVAEVPELPGCLAHGDTQQAALRNVNQAMDLWLDTAREFGDPIPEPKGERLMLAWRGPRDRLPRSPWANGWSRTCRAGRTSRFPTTMRNPTVRRRSPTGMTPTGRQATPS